MNLKVRLINPGDFIGKWENQEWLTFNVTAGLTKLKSAIREYAKRGKYKVKFTYDKDAGVLWAKRIT